MSLATKYRPQTLDDVVGQNQIINILKKELETDNVKHAYLFDGKTGTGKSSCSRILAKSLNADLLEMDVASHNSIDDVKELLESIKSIPLTASKIVIILDECQSWFSRRDSLAAQAILKTLEEPRKHVYFILCTTEGDKVIDTIKNRCECFHFNSVSTEDIISRLKYICEQENIKYENEEVLRFIAENSGGSMRTAISKLETLGTKVTMKAATSLFKTSYNTMFKLLYAVLSDNKQDCIKIIDEIEDVQKFVDSLFTVMLDVCIYNKSKNAKLTNLPSLIIPTLKFTDEEEKIIVNFTKILLKLQYNGKNSPILRELLKAELIL